MPVQHACPTSKNGSSRHGTRTLAVETLRRGKQIEQFLGGFEHEGRQALRRIALNPDRKGVTI